MNFNKGDGASFFKILLRDSEDYFPLPTAFANKYLEKWNNKKQTIILKTKSGVNWRVKYTYLKSKDIYCFTNGWLNFMKENRLHNGDFLVFWLMSSVKPTFRVFFFGPNGCLINNRTSCSRKYSTVVPITGHSFDQSLTRDFAKVTGIQTCDSVRLKNSKGKWEVGIRNWGRGRARMPNLVERWSEFIKDNKVKVGDTCVFSQVKDNLFHVHLIKKKKGSPISIKPRKTVKEINQSLSRDDHVVAPFTFQEIKGKILFETDIFSQEEQKKWSRNTAVEAAKSFKSDYPHYKVTIKDSYNRSKKLHVPMWFFRRYLSSNEECVKCVLKVANGKKWGPIKCRGYNKYGYGRMYGDKLKKFCDENHLVVGDACVFELINKVLIGYDANKAKFVNKLQMLLNVTSVTTIGIGDGAEGTLGAIDLGATGLVTTAGLTVIAVGATVAGGVAVIKGIKKYVPTANDGLGEDFYKISFKNLFKSK
ncbi:DNA-binding pseudobarrel domain-containing protein [Tanacetum coccineum]